VPAEYQPVYGYLNNKLDAYQPGVPAPGATTRFGAELFLANSAVGDGLLDQPWVLRSVPTALDRMQELGMRGVTISVHENALARSSRTAEFLAFYRQVVSAVKARGLLLLIESAATFGIDYTGITYASYLQARRTALQIILAELQPHYLAVATEPDTEASLTRLAELTTPTGYSAFVASLLDGLPRGTTLVGAGTGTWGDPTYMQMLAQLPVDFLDIHVYPIARDFLPRIGQFVGLARQLGKRTLVGEAWLYKATVDEMPILSPPVIFARDPFSFWQPLDQKWLKKLVDTARVQQMDFFSIFGTHYCFAYLEYNEVTKHLPWQQLTVEVGLQALRNMGAGIVTPTGQFYRSLIAGASTGAATGPIPTR
jgi:hypothetical protein